MWTIIIFALFGLVFSVWMIIREIQLKEFDWTSIVVGIVVIFFFSCIGYLISTIIPSKSCYRVKSSYDIALLQDSSKMALAGIINDSKSYAVMYNGDLSPYQIKILPKDSTTIEYTTNKPIFVIYEKVPDPDVFINNFSTNFLFSKKYKIIIPKGTLINISNKDGK